MAAPKPKSQTKILIIDAHETSRHVISIMLYKMGYPNVMEADSQAKAEKIIDQHCRSNAGAQALLGAGSAPTMICDLDLVIMDFNLDNNDESDDGLMYLAQLRSRFDAGSLPILFTVMKGKEGNLGGAEKYGANDTMMKPFSQEKFKLKVEPMLTGQKAPVIQSFDFSGAAKKASVLETKKPEPKKLDIDEPAKAAPPPAPVMKAPPPVPKAPIAPPLKSNGKKDAKPLGGPSFHGRKKEGVYSKEDGPTATLVDGEINGHYHEKVDVIGGGENCYWAQKIDGQEMVKLEYLTAKGKSTGMEAKIIPLEQFIYTFYLCEEHGCAILSRLAAEA